MTGPGSPSIQNVVAMRYLGTSSTAAFWPATVAVIAQFVLISIWLEYRTKALTKKGYTFYEDPTIKPLEDSGIELSVDNLPNPIISAIPAVLILVFLI